MVGGGAPGAVSVVLDVGAAHERALTPRERVLRAFVGEDGRLRSLPAKRTKRLVVLDLVARLFEPGQRYPEAEVNAVLRAVHDDTAALRRYLVDEGFLDRDHGVYWRCGGSVVVGASPATSPATSPVVGPVTGPVVGPVTGPVVGPVTGLAGDQPVGTA